MSVRASPTDFQLRVYYALTKNVPEGKVTSYGAIAKAIGCGSSQAVGVALANNPYAPTVPCHRVINTSGAIGGLFGHKSCDSLPVTIKIKLLRSEGVKFVNGKAIRVNNASMISNIPALGSNLDTNLLRLFEEEIIKQFKVVQLPPELVELEESGVKNPLKRKIRDDTKNGLFQSKRKSD